MYKAQLMFFLIIFRYCATFEISLKICNNDNTQIMSTFTFGKLNKRLINLEWMAEFKWGK